jgi:hypothetical protein
MFVKRFNSFLKRKSIKFQHCLIFNFQKCFDNMSTRTQTTSATGYTRTIQSTDIPMLNFEKDK